jgi:hypothetical protein
LAQSDGATKVMSWNPAGNLKGPKGDPGDAVGATVASVFGRLGAVVAQAGDYDAAKITNALSSLGSYSDPSWLTSLSWSKITGVPSWVTSFNGRIGAIAPAVNDYSFAQLSGKPTTLAGYAITDAQPLDSDLTAIAALTTTGFGRGFLDRIDGAAARLYMGLGSASLADVSSFKGAFTFAQSLQQALEGSTATLVGDIASPAASSYYGTNASGQRGWFALPTPSGPAPVSSVFGRTGAVVANSSDYSGMYAPAIHTHSFASLTAIPTTLSGYGISDAYTKSEVAAGFASISHTHTFASLTSKPTTLSGYGITDAQPAGSYEAPLSFQWSIARSGNTINLAGDAATPGASKYYGTDAAGARGFFAIPTGLGSPLAFVQTAELAPVAVAGTAGKMIGVGATGAITPKVSGKVFVQITCGGLFTSGGAYFSLIDMLYGTGTAPANGAAYVGTKIGNRNQTPPGSPNQPITGVWTALLTGLTVNTKYWFDLGASGSNAAALTNFTNLIVTAFELPTS